MYKIPGKSIKIDYLQNYLKFIYLYVMVNRAVLWLRHLETSLSQKRFKPYPRPVHMGFVLKKLAVG